MSSMSYVGEKKDGDEKASKKKTSFSEKHVTDKKPECLAATIGKLELSLRWKTQRKNGEDTRKT